MIPPSQVPTKASILSADPRGPLPPSQLPGAAAPLSLWLHHPSLGLSPLLSPLIWPALGPTLIHTRSTPFTPDQRVWGQEIRA